MSNVSPAEEAEFWKSVEEATKKAIWCALASVDSRGRPRVRIVHPTWDGRVLWLATGASSPKAKQLAANPHVDVQFQVAPPDFVHVLVRGRAELVRDAALRQHAWDVIDYDLSQFWPKGVGDPEYLPIRVVPSRVELSKMFGTLEKRVWRAT